MLGHTPEEALLPGSKTNHHHLRAGSYQANQQNGRVLPTFRPASCTFQVCIHCPLLSGSPFSSTHSTQRMRFCFCVLCTSPILHILRVTAFVLCVWCACREPAQRPSAKAALGHAWLQGRAVERTQGAPLKRTVVQRLQRYGVENPFK